VGFIEPVGTIYQSAIADLKDVAIIRAIKREQPHAFHNDINSFFKDVLILNSFILNDE